MAENKVSEGAEGAETPAETPAQTAEISETAAQTGHALSDGVRREVKCSYYKRAKAAAFRCLAAMKPVDPVSATADGWEGVMLMLADIVDGGTAEEIAAGIMAAAKWVAVDIREGAREEVGRIARLVDLERKASAAHSAAAGSKGVEP